MTFPYNKFEALSFEQVNDTRINKPRLFRNRQRGNKASFFMISLQTDPIPYNDYMGLVAKINAYEGSLELFDLPNPFPTPNSIGTQSVDANANANSKFFITTGQPDLRAGAFIRFNNHAKVYQIASTEVSGSDLKVNLSSGLVSSITSSNTFVYGDNVNFQVCLDSVFTAEIEGSSGNFGVIDVEVIEQL